MQLSLNCDSRDTYIKFGFLLKNVIAFFCTFMRSGESALRIVDKLLHHGSNIIYVLREDGVNFG